jgi:hypothetical protein
MRSVPQVIAILLSLLVHVPARAGELKVSTNFEGGSATVESIDQEKRVIQLTSGGDPQRGWPCWWYARIDGLGKDERLILNVGASKLPARNDGKETGKPLNENWSIPNRAAFSTDGETWQQTAPGHRNRKRMVYELTGTGEPLWVAWGPPFTPKDTDALIAAAEKAQPTAKGFELAKTRENRPVRGFRIAMGSKLRGVWIQARQHAWESGGSWVARGLAEWVTSADPNAQWLREHAEIVVVPIMDVDNVATGNGGKEANPRDHNRDWDNEPHYPEVAAAQKQLKAWANEERMDVFVDLHNPGATSMQPFFYVGPEELLKDQGRKNRENFIRIAERTIADPLHMEAVPKVTGPTYHPLWRQISGQWVTDHGNPHTMAICLETAWNTPHSTSQGYLAVGRQLGQTIAEYLRGTLAQ